MSTTTEGHKTKPAVEKEKSFIQNQIDETLATIDLIGRNDIVTIYAIIIVLVYCIIVFLVMAFLFVQDQTKKNTLYLAAVCATALLFFMFNERRLKYNSDSQLAPNTLSSK